MSVSSAKPIPSDFGAAFPTQPDYGSHKPFWRTDLDLEFYYDGTRWLSTQVFQIELKIEDVGITWPPTANQLPVHRGTLPFGSDYAYYLLDWQFLVAILTTNDGTKYWTMNLYKYNSAGGGDAVVATGNTSADSITNAYIKKYAINALLGSFVGFYTEVIKTSTPGAIRFHGGHINCHLVAT